jgi:hypothetical protein
MSVAAFFAFLEANGYVILGLWLVFEQWIAANERLKSNSTLQLVINTGKSLLGRYSKEK